MKFKKIAIITLAISGVLSLVADLIYGSKVKAEEYLFGNFMANLSSFSFSLFSVITLVSLVLLIIKKFGPKLIERLAYDSDYKKSKLNRRLIK